MTKTGKQAAIGWVPAGSDPTELDYEMERPTLAGCGSRIGQIMIILLAVYGAIQIYMQSQSRSAAAITPTPAPPAEIIVIRTATPAATWTPMIITTTPEFVDRPTLTAHTATPTLTATTTPTPTATLTPPAALATWTPGVWMVTRWSATLEGKNRP
ncbi:MAG TPA: hypothetical protein PLD47_13900 [Aggregatilineales bacterium]|nr:MAG: hypothetical protein HKUEN02_01090 [Anaerolineaceae bacterium]HRE48815.1 hypothetical protein [Aggregatilineales bacterium]